MINAISFTLLIGIIILLLSIIVVTKNLQLPKAFFDKQQFRSEIRRKLISQELKRREVEAEALKELEAEKKDPKKKS